MSDKTVGLIGIGLAGGALAKRWLDNGWTVVGYDPDPERRTYLQEQRGSPVGSEIDVAHECQRIVLSLPTSHVASDVLDRILPVLAADAIIVDTTTGEPKTMIEMARRVTSRGRAYLDAPIAGSSEHIRKGEAVFLVGGLDEDLDRCLDLLVAASSRILHVGEAGAGAKMKLVTNLVLGLHRLVLAEGLSFAQACGIDPQKAFQALIESPAKSEAMLAKGPKMLSGDFTAQARLRQHFKDVQLIQSAAEDMSASIPLTNLHAGILRELIDRDLGDFDNSVILKAFVDQLGPPAASESG
ncbi:MAG: NAD(P)-dependent oxidoreductase [Planctomycetaceae bacterium]|nr:NAD(P)-dependent oxidoreductase [Planctomycetaceae bacterium]